MTLDVTFDGKVFIADEPVDLPVNTRARVFVESVAGTSGTKSQSFIDTALSLNLEGPENWSENFEDHLNAQRANTHE